MRLFAVLALAAALHARKSRSEHDAAAVDDDDVEHAAPPPLHELTDEQVQRARADCESPDTLAAWIESGSALPLDAWLARASFSR
jgi:hypothetical protein